MSITAASPFGESGGGSSSSALVAVVIATSFLGVLAISAACFRGGSVSFETPFTKLNLDVNPPKEPPADDEDGDRPSLPS